MSSAIAAVEAEANAASAAAAKINFLMVFNLSFAHVRLSKGIGRSGSAFLLLSANLLLFAAWPN
jgi:hypothetical protein